MAPKGDRKPSQMAVARGRERAPRKISPAPDLLRARPYPTVVNPRTPAARARKWGPSR